MTFDKACSEMKAKFTYKELTLLAGVVVALIIIITLWFNPIDTENTSTFKKNIHTTTTPITKAVIKKVVQTVQRSIY